MITTILSCDDVRLRVLAVQVGAHLSASHWRLVTAESCTGGWIGKVLTDIAGSSAWYSGGAVVYSNDLKQRVLGVPAESLAEHGAVSEEVVRTMAEGAVARLGGDIGVAVSGIAGPGGGTQEKPIGLVCFAWSRVSAGRVETISHREVFPGDREQVRRQTVAYALERILTL